MASTDDRSRIPTLDALAEATALAELVASEAFEAYGALPWDPDQESDLT